MGGEELVFTFASTHAAITGEATLVKEGLGVRVMAKPDSIGAGCGICLRVSPKDGKTAEKLLTENGAAPEGIFLSKRTSQGREYTPCKI